MFLGSVWDFRTSSSSPALSPNTLPWFSLDNLHLTPSNAKKHTSLPLCTIFISHDPQPSPINTQQQTTKTTQPEKRGWMKQCGGKVIGDRRSALVVGGRRWSLARILRWRCRACGVHTTGFQNLAQPNPVVHPTHFTHKPDLQIPKPKTKSVYLRLKRRDGGFSCPRKKMEVFWCLAVVKEWLRGNEDRKWREDMMVEWRKGGRNRRHKWRRKVQEVGGAWWYAEQHENGSEIGILSA